MSKIAEQKALEEYPIKIRHSMDSNRNYREGYIVGYDQAIQDFLDKSCEWWSTMPDDTYGFNPCKIYVEQFKNYMKKEA